MAEVWHDNPVESSAPSIFLPQFSRTNASLFHPAVSSSFLTSVVTDCTPLTFDFATGPLHPTEVRMWPQSAFSFVYRTATTLIAIINRHLFLKEKLFVSGSKFE
jgi:hypothetical protein